MGQVQQSCKTRKTGPPSTQGKPRTRRSKSTAKSSQKNPKSTPSTSKKSSNFKVQSSKLENFGVKILSAAKALPICEVPEFDTLKGGHEFNLLGVQVSDPGLNVDCLLNPHTSGRKFPKILQFQGVNTQEGRKSGLEFKTKGKNKLGEGASIHPWDNVKATHQGLIHNELRINALTPRSPEKKEKIKPGPEMSRTVCRPELSQVFSKQDPEEASVITIQTKTRSLRDNLPQNGYSQFPPPQKKLLSKVLFGLKFGFAVMQPNFAYNKYVLNKNATYLIS